MGSCARCWAQSCSARRVLRCSCRTAASWNSNASSFFNSIGMFGWCPPTCLATRRRRALLRPENEKSQSLRRSIASGSTCCCCRCCGTHRPPAYAPGVRATSGNLRHHCCRVQRHVQQQHRRFQPCQARSAALEQPYRTPHRSSRRKCHRQSRADLKQPHCSYGFDAITRGSTPTDASTKHELRVSVFDEKFGEISSE